jgi:hypothetical protein
MSFWSGRWIGAKMKRMLWTVVFLATCLFSIRATDASSREKWVWTTKYPPGFEIARDAPKHPDLFVMKDYSFRHGGRVADFFHDVGKADKFSRQTFLNERQPYTQPKNKLCGTFKYYYKDGTVIFMTTHNMKDDKYGTIFAIIKRPHKDFDLLYK